MVFTCRDGDTPSVQLPSAALVTTVEVGSLGYLEVSVCKAITSGQFPAVLGPSGDRVGRIRQRIERLQSAAAPSAAFCHLEGESAAQHGAT